jgi:hypothetical protein
MKKNVQNLKMFALALGLVLVFSGVNAQTRTATNDGPWNSTATWGGLSIPTAANAVVLPNGIDVNVPVGITAAAASITWTGSNTLTVNTGGTLNVTGALIIQNLASGTRLVNINGAGTLNAASLQIGGTTTSLTADGTTTLVSTIGNLSISGNLSLFGEDDGSDDNNSTLSIPSGTITVNGTILTDEEFGSSVSLTMDGTAPETGTLIVNGNTPFQNVAGTLGTDLDGSGATVRFNGGAQDVPLLNYRHLSLDGTNINTSIKTLAGDVTVLGNLTVGENATLQLLGDDINTSSNGAVTTINGRLVIDGNGRLNNTGGTGTLVLGGNPGQLFITDNGGSTLPVFENYSFDSNSVVYYASTDAQTISSAPLYGNLVTGDDGFGAGNGSGVKTITSSLEVINSVVIGQNTTLACQAGGANSDNITVGGTWVNNGTFVPADDQVIFDGTSTQELRGPNVTTFFNLRTNKVDPEFGTNLTSNIIVTGTITLSTGFFGSNNGSIVIMNAGSSHTGASDNAKITTRVRKLGGTAFTFPVGKDNMYSPITITATGEAADAFEAEYVREAASLLGPVATGIGITNVSFCEYWDLDEVADPGNNNTVSVTVTWDAQTPCNGLGYITNLAGLTLAHFNGTVWDSHGGTATGNTTAGSITRTGVTTFSPFSLANTISGANPLPVKFSQIKAYEKQAGIQIDWTSYQEINVDNYLVERSADGKNFSMIGTVDALNQANDINYGYFDANPLPGVNFYRIRNIDLDGKSGFSNIVRISLDKSVKDITMYPNPVRNGAISLQSSDLARGKYSVSVYNAGGQHITTKQFTHNGGAINQTITLPANTQSGLYMLNLQNDGVRVMAKTFVVQQ